MGYSGLMLPPLEDATLARRQMLCDNEEEEEQEEQDEGQESAKKRAKTTTAEEKKKGTKKRAYGVTDLLAFSAVCGVGLDTVPIPGDTSHAAVAATLLDTAALAARWNKPLSARLFPVPGLQAGDLTSFESPFLINTRVFDV